MNYRHAYHAGNHADVLKHAVLARVVERLAAKNKPFAVLDTHAGAGAYDLQSVEAAKTGEWQSGIGLMNARFGGDVEAVLAGYRAVCVKLNAGDQIRYYPGSPEIALALLRGGDRLIANELQPNEADILRGHYVGDCRLFVTQTDALAAIKQHLPFKERRGLVLIDPPYEARDEADKVRAMLVETVRRFAGAVVMIWYPVTTDAFVDRLLDGVVATGISNIVCAELRVKKAHEASGLSGSGMIIRNPPFGLEEDLGTLMPALSHRLEVGGLGRSSVEWLTPKRG